MANYFTERVLHLIRYGDEAEDDDEGGSSGGHSQFGPINIQVLPEIPPGEGNDPLFGIHPLLAKMPSGIPPKMSAIPSENPVAEQVALSSERFEHRLTAAQRQRHTSTPTMTRK